ncbi:phosphatidylcholine/phosphatidylserine synthase [Francisella philomiragia]|uniref:CDP-alcohol phosphatidyltransferase n=1 Tax=Francisella philomiragia subsp. philomiragia (strain ATCC 25017 / CCUG 19701 / FSC 153 / O\|nr:phosphatidylcholine/phosphatidylserine synthase [Francisella philomiragia]AJI47047.1 CDP-alcohol phosphatidyltransferase family protein [Francisella philomiragia]AJI49946.1 CDP-alcohol phosphatidyltransferase family protein [Francisella philomiragia]MBK2021029.1 phosphatidylcholine/phosphatidylserine synthase [Francisella philomiragia]MBK2030266.1 phosphatidylcholine/phosphatidylserine synthase [Francisella philomiragia]MBK2264528.1 phosphatidylcholine/phosphatidylserine synthase [Francisel
MWLLENIDMKKSKYILPSLFTSASLLFAFLAIIAAFQGNFISSAVYMLLAGFADAFDGRVARYTHTQTEFGAALDSLADVVSFGATPALVMYFWSLHNLGALGAAIAFLYLLAVALRLAKFDTMLASDNSEESMLERRLYFYGMPCPAGAVTISGLIWMGQRFLVGDSTFLSIVVVVLTAFTALYLAFMMVSDIKFRSFKDSDGKGNISKLYVICFILIILMLFTMPDKLLYFIMIGYALSGPVSHYRYKQKIKNSDFNEDSVVDGKKIIDAD